MTKPPAKPEKIEEGSRVYRARAIAIAFDFAPAIYPCHQCGNPVTRGYCCRYCKTDAPEPPTTNTPVRPGR